MTSPEPPRCAIPDIAPVCPEPVRRAVMVQRWSDIVFLHWRYDPAVVQARLPDGLDVDIADGAAWIALVPFRMEGLGLPGIAPLPHVGAFPEVNVRTYVVRRDADGIERRGVWFFSLDVDRMLPVLAARAAYHLPYYSGQTSHTRAGDLLTTSVDRHWPRAAAPARTSIAVRSGGAADPDDPLDRFLTARWGLFARTRRGSWRYAPVDHSPWPLHHGEVLHLDDGLITAAGFPPPDGEPHVRCSTGVDVRIGRPQRSPNRRVGGTR